MFIQNNLSTKGTTITKYQTKCSCASFALCQEVTNVLPINSKKGELYIWKNWVAKYTYTAVKTSLLGPNNFYH